MKQKLITIITVVYNGADLIEDTIKSVLCHNLNDFEYVIVDGGSTDGTIDIINKYRSQISVFVSEADKGIYDAMNKGILLSSGQFVGFINCGDKLLKLPLKEIENNTISHINCFPVSLSNGKNIFPKISSLLKLKNTLPHQGCFYKKNDSLFYDIDYKVFSDFNLNQTIYKNNYEIKVFKNPIVAFHDMGGISHNKKYSYEIFKVVQSNFGLKYKFISWVYFKMRGLSHRFKK
jgi:glycosyltransferase involved in cell wall biosynthesis